MPQKYHICKIIKDESAFNQPKRKTMEWLSKSCKNWELGMCENKKKTLLTYQHLWARKDVSKIINSLKIVDDYKHICVKDRKEKVVREFVIYGSKYNPNTSRTSKVCNDYREKEDKKRIRNEFIDEWYWNGHLKRRKIDHVFIPAEIACSTYEDSN